MTTALLTARRRSRTAAGLAAILTVAATARACSGGGSCERGAATVDEDGAQAMLLAGFSVDVAGLEQLRRGHTPDASGSASAG